MGPSEKPRPLGPGQTKIAGCPSCGSADYKKVKPEAAVVYTYDRICKACGTRYTPPTPRWARVVFGIIGVGALLLGLAAVVMAFKGGIQKTGEFLGIAASCVAIDSGCLYQALKGGSGAPGRSTATPSETARELPGEPERPSPATVKSSSPECYLCGKALQPDEMSARVCKACRVEGH
jgi:hypothetical protein